MAKLPTLWQRADNCATCGGDEGERMGGGGGGGARAAFLSLCSNLMQKLKGNCNCNCGTGAREERASRSLYQAVTVRCQRFHAPCRKLTTHSRSQIKQTEAAPAAGATTRRRRRRPAVADAAVQMCLKNQAAKSRTVS